MRKTEREACIAINGIHIYAPEGDVIFCKYCGDIKSLKGPISTAKLERFDNAIKTLHKEYGTMVSTDDDLFISIKKLLIEKDFRVSKLDDMLPLGILYENLVHKSQFLIAVVISSLIVSQSPVTFRAELPDRTKASGLFTMVNATLKALDKYVEFYWQLLRFDIHKKFMEIEVYGHDDSTTISSFKSVVS